MKGAGAISGFRDRFGGPADTDALVLLINVAFRPEQIAIEGDRINAEKLQPFFRNGKFIVLEDDEGLAGCVYAEVRGSRGYIGLLALRPALQGRGLGKRLMALAEEYLAGAGCEAADLRTISARSDLVPIYKHLGYEETGTAPMPPEIPLKIPCHFINMSKPLRSYPRKNQTARSKQMKTTGLIFAAMIAPAAGLAQSAATPPAKTPTAQEIVDRIKVQVGIAWMAQTRDTFKAGDPQTPVTGIAVTMMATMSVLQRAAANGQNMIITHEPTFFDDADKAETVAQGEQDPVLAEKRAFIEKHHLVIWRFHDHQHRMQMDQVEQGNARKLGWEKYRDPANQYLFTLPATTVGKLAEEARTRFGAAAVRIVGDREMKVSRVGLSPGAGGARKEIAALEMPDLQVLLVGETREWETVEYVADAVSEGRHKALIVLSHVPSEQSGAEECARWLKTLVNEVPIEFVATPDPFEDGALLRKP